MDIKDLNMRERGKFIKEQEVTIKNLKHHIEYLAESCRMYENRFQAIQTIITTQHGSYNRTKKPVIDWEIEERYKNPWFNL